MGTTAGFAQVQSPLLHDAVTGIRITPRREPSVFSLPGLNGPDLNPQDTLVATISGGAAETDVMLLHPVLHEPARRGPARLHSWGDIEGNIANIKPPARRGSPLSADDRRLDRHAAVHHGEPYSRPTRLRGDRVHDEHRARRDRHQGHETGNLRVAGPGSTQEFPTTSYFKYMGEKTGRPYVPVVNAANINNLFVSTLRGHRIRGGRGRADPGAAHHQPDHLIGQDR